ncbi:DUF1080 domain-containing protein [Temperatibacter marinus]|uniref:DUF1080 domain-containing protein n=1 Tax=Temperatibacter marinus TaxID=1456591 RepID=A0AA52H992_9PROT|nr:DUF1080 domain-containing protein [Temperatibacter marinus]WND02946.1 DUF1080 domain-containing protein [Temperatibacter marinus]
MKILTIGTLLISLSATLSVALEDGAQDMKPEDTEVWEGEPKRVSGSLDRSPPSDAILLFDGKSLSQWVSKADGSAASWTIEKGVMTVRPGAGDIKTKLKFKDVQLHIEWRSPEGEDHRTGQDKGNSGVFLQERYEVQVLNSYKNRTYSNGQAASVYKQTIPLANATAKTGEWNVYDIFYTAPRFHEDGSLKTSAFVTVMHNNVLVQNHTEIKGETVYIGAPFYKAHGAASLMLQDHSNKVSYRNIWVRPLAE